MNEITQCALTSWPRAKRSQKGSAKNIDNDRSRSCLVCVDVSCSGFMEAGSMRSPGLLHIANSVNVLPLRVTSVFLTVAALRISWAGVICDRVVSSRFLEAVSTCAERKLFNSRTPCGC